MPPSPGVGSGSVDAERLLLAAAQVVDQAGGQAGSGGQGDDVGAVRESAGGDRLIGGVAAGVRGVRAAGDRDRHAERGAGDDRLPGLHLFVIGGVLDVQAGGDSGAGGAIAGVELGDVQQVDLGPVVDPDLGKAVGRVRRPGGSGDDARLEDHAQIRSVLLIARRPGPPRGCGIGRGPGP